MRQAVYIIFIFASYLVTSCDSSIEGKVESKMRSYISAFNDKDVDALLEHVHPSVFQVVSKQDVAYDFNLDRYQRKIMLKGLNKLYGPYEHDGISYVLADFKFQKGKVFFKRHDNVPYVFASDNEDDWYIIPYSLDFLFEYDRRYELLSYRIMRRRDTTTFADLIPIEVLTQMHEDYIPGSKK